MIAKRPVSSVIAVCVPCSAGEFTTTVTPARSSPVLASHTPPAIAPAVADRLAVVGLIWQTGFGATSRGAGAGGSGVLPTGVVGDPDA